jgi:hypothetical protein
MNAFATTDLLNDIVALGLDTLCRPAADFEGRRERCRSLQARLASEIKTSAGASRFLDNFAPLLLRAIERSMSQWIARDENNGARWDGLVGFLVAQARRDSGDAIAAVSDVARSAGG